MKCLGMVTKDFERFNEFSHSCGNTFLAVRTVAKWARDLGIKFHEYHISESKLIQMIISGGCYYTDAEMLKRRTYSDDDHIDDILNWVIDDDIVAEVKRLYRSSIKERHLTSCDSDRFTKGQTSKINILLKMIWYSTSDRKEIN